MLLKKQNKLLHWNNWLIQISWILILVVPTVKGQRVSVFDCERANVTYHNYNDYCKVEEKTEPAKTLNVYYKNSYVFWEGFACKEEVSSITSYCGLWSYSKIAAPLSIGIVNEVSSSTCLWAVLENSLVGYDNKRHSLSNGRVTYKYLSHGQLKYSADNIRCSGECIHLSNTTVCDIVEFSTVVFTVRQVKSRFDPITGHVLGKQFKYKVNEERGYFYAFVHDNTMVWPSKAPSYCDLFYQKEEVSLFKKGNVLYNHLLELVFEIKGMVNDSCLGEVIATNYDQMFIGHEIDNSTVLFHRYSNLTMEIVLFKSYSLFLEQWSTRQLELTERALHCESAKEREGKRYQVKSNKFFLVKGDLLLIFRCQELTLTLPKKLTHCYKNRFVGLKTNETAVVQFYEKNRLVVPQADKGIKVACSERRLIGLESTNATIYWYNVNDQLEQVVVHNDSEKGFNFSVATTLLLDTHLNQFLSKLKKDDIKEFISDLSCKGINECHFLDSQELLEAFWSNLKKVGSSFANECLNIFEIAFTTIKALPLFLLGLIIFIVYLHAMKWKRHRRRRRRHERTLDENQTTEIG